MTRNLIHYYAEYLPGNRAQLHVDVVVDDKIVPELSHPVGSPAPRASVEACEHTIHLGSKEGQ